MDPPFFLRQRRCACFAALEFHRAFAVGVAGAAPERLPGVLAGVGGAQARETAANLAERWLCFLLIGLMGLISPI